MTEPQIENAQSVTLSRYLAVLGRLAPARATDPGYKQLVVRVVEAAESSLECMKTMVQ